MQSMTMLESPLYSGYISMLCRNAPFLDIDDVRKVLESGIEKECEAAMGSGPYLLFNWRPIMSHDPSTRSIAIAPGYPINPQLHGQIYSSLLRARNQICSMLLYPDYSRKTIGYKGARNFGLLAEELRELEIDPGYISTMDLERLYHKTGAEITGETEVRWAWKFNDLKPRIYYARGPSVFYASRYIQAIFNTFVDAFNATNRFTRYHHSSLVIPPDDTAFIYDYSSFTSKLECIRDFVEALAEFCSGSQVDIVDSFSGIRTMDLGDILMDYYEVCCDFPRMDLGKLEGVPFSDEYLDNHTCGMLGVPGNISSSTLFHGIHLIIVMQDLLVKCVGDDAFANGKVQDRADLISVLQNIGEVSPEKVEFWMGQLEEEDEGIEREELDRGWNYVKRPIDRIDTRLAIGEQYIFPPIARFGRWTDSFHTQPGPMKEATFQKKCANDLISFARQFSVQHWADEDLAFINWTLRIYLRECGLENKNGPNHIKGGLIYPRYVTNQGFVEDMLESYWNTCVRIPFPASRYTGDTSYQGLGMESHMHVTKAIAYARDMGHAIIEPETYAFIVRDDPELFESFISKAKYASISTVTILETAPSWIQDLVNTSLSNYTVREDQDMEDYDSDYDVLPLA